MKIKLFVLTLLLVCFPAFADINTAVKAYIEGNYTTAVKDLQPLVEQGEPRAEFLLGHMYYRGQGVPKDPIKAEQLLLLSAKHGFAKAQSYIGFLYVLKGDEAHLKQALLWFQNSAAQGDREGENLLGFMYEMGKAVPRNYQKAVHWYQIAANQGDSWGQYNLGYMYLHGFGVNKNVTTAAALYQKSAQQGFRIAQLRLGELYRDGLGVKQDKIQAYAWMSTAVANGYEQARLARDELAKTLSQNELIQSEMLAKKYITLYKYNS
jgi:TPR repeat protein